MGAANHLLNLAVMLCIAQAAMATDAIRIAVIVPPSSSIAAGARVGAEEARRTASLLGRDLRVDVEEVSDPAGAAAAARRAASAGAAAVIGGLRPDIADAIAGATSVPFLAMEPSDAPLRDDRYRITPTRAQIEAATGGREGVRAVAWHPALFRYGAGELNERFRDAAGVPMDSEAWTAWMAIKLVAEAVLRDREIGSMRIDAHKGVPLRFDGDRVLQQPLYVVDDRGNLIDD